MSTKWPQGEITPNIPASVLGGNNISGVYTLDQLNRLNADFGPQMQKSLRFRSSASAYLNRTPSVAGNRQTWTWSGWVKRGTLGSFQAVFSAGVAGPSYTYTYIRFTTTDNIEFLNYPGSLGGNITTTQAFRDPGAWYHIVTVFDSTNATSTDRMRLYVNGVRVTALSGGTFGTVYPAQNEVSMLNYSSYNNYIGRNPPADLTQYFDGYMAEVNFIDGQALTPSSFGKYNATTGVWQPIFYAGTYGTNGFRLTFANNASTTTLGYDSSPNGNNWTTLNFSLTAGSTYDSMQDVPTNWTSGDPIQARGNYAVLNPLDKSSYITNSDGNLAISTSYSGAHNLIRSTISLPSSGKFYAEMTFGSTMTGNPAAAFALIAANAGVNTHPVSAGNYSVYGSVTTGLYSGGTGGATVTGMTTGQVWQFAVDVDGGNAWIGLNNAWYNVYTSGATTGNPSTGANPTFSGGSFAGMFFGADLINTSAIINLGQRPFAYTPPTGFKSLCTQNLPAPAIYNGANHMAVTTYTGTGSSLSISNSVNSASFQPDLVWIKSRSAATDHALYDVIRGTQNRLESNTTDAAVAADNGLTAFGSSGFTVNTLAQVNTNAATYVGWQWKANGTAVSNNAGSITSQVSANTTAGFSVVTYTGTGANATVGHGLGVAPSFIICKARGSQGTSSDWACYHVALGATNRIWLNLTNATAANIVYWNNTAPTSSVFSLGTEGTVNTNSNTNVAYCFAAIAGYSAFGSYTGNGSADGPFVYCGFRPRWVMYKCTSASGTSSNWVIQDTSRNPYNSMPNILLPNLANAELTDPATTGGYPIDCLSNGFKIRNTNDNWNTSGGTYIYAAFCESPFQNSLAR